MIRTFACRDTKKLFNDKVIKKFFSCSRQARVKLDLLNAVCTIAELRSPPSNHLESLIGNRKGQYIVFELINSGVFVSSGMRAMLTMLKLLTIIREDDYDKIT